MNKQLFNGFYCRKCNSIPLIEILPHKNISIFFVCRCRKKYQDIDLFNNNYYNKNIDVKKICLNKNNEYLEKSTKNKLEKNKEINNIINEYYKTKNEFYTYSKEIKDNLITDLMLNIEKINDSYEKHILLNKKIENIYEILIESYKKIDDNISNIKNIINNSNFNKKPNCYNYSFESIISFYENEFFLKSPEQLKTDKLFQNHSDVNCFLDYKINDNQYYGVSSSYSSNIALYDLIQNKHLFTFKGDKYQINCITLSSQNNIISCGNEYCIKIWPLIDYDKIIELNKILIKDNTINLSPIYIFKCEESNIDKIEYIKNNDKNANYDYLLCNLHNSLYVYKYIKDIKGNFPNNSKIDLISKYTKAALYNFIILKKNIYNNCYNDLICGFGIDKIYLFNFPKLLKINKSKILEISLINNCVQINNDELLLIEYNILTIFNFTKFQKKLSIKIDDNIHCITILRDNTIILGGIKGIKRFLNYNFKELPKLNNGYEDEEVEKNEEDEEDDYMDREPEQILCIKELLDGRIVFCYRNKGINISKLNIF